MLPNDRGLGTEATEKYVDSLTWPPEQPSYWPRRAGELWWRAWLLLKGRFVSPLYPPAFGPFAIWVGWYGHQKQNERRGRRLVFRGAELACA